MTGNATLKIAAFISVGIHLLVFAIASKLFRYPSLSQTEMHSVRVILHPLPGGEKPGVKIIPPVPLKMGDQDQRQPLKITKGPSGDSVSFRTSFAKTIFQEPMPDPKNKEEEEIRVESGSIVTPPGPGSGKPSDLEKEGSGTPDGSAPNGEQGSAPFAGFSSGEFDGGTFSYNSRGNKNGSGAGTGHPAGISTGSGKGGGILGKFFSSPGGGNGGRPRYAENPKPPYPQEAREKGHQGEVLLRVEVLVDGKVGQIEIRRSSGYALLDQSALATVRQWRFVPAKKGEVPVSLWVNIPIKFQLQ